MQEYSLSCCYLQTSSLVLYLSTVFLTYSHSQTMSRYSSRRSSKRERASSLFVRNVSYQSKPEDLRKLFSKVRKS